MTGLRAGHGGSLHLLEAPLVEGQETKMLGEILKSSFCGRFSGRWDDVSSDAGAAWSTIRKLLREKNWGGDHNS